MAEDTEAGVVYVELDDEEEYPPMPIYPRREPAQWPGQVGTGLFLIWRRVAFVWGSWSMLRALWQLAAHALGLAR